MIFLDFGAGVAFTPAAAKDTVKLAGITTLAGVNLILKTGWALGVTYALTEFESNHPRIPGFIGYSIPPPHILKTTSVLAGKHHAFNHHFSLGVMAGPGFSTITYPVNIREVSGTAPFLGTLRGYQYQMASQKQVGLTTKIIFSAYRSKWIGCNMGGYFHLNQSPRLSSGTLFCALALGRMR